MSNLEEFDKLKFDKHPSGAGIAAMVEYPNGYGASVIQGRLFYTDNDDEYEVAVLNKGHLTYDTPITSDVMGHLTKVEVNNTLKAIKAL